MRLERLEATQRPEKLKAVFDGETLTVSASLCVQFSLCAGMELDEEAFSALKAAVAKEAARERAVRILTASAVSERELEKRLVQKGTLPADAADAVAWLKEAPVPGRRGDGGPVGGFCRAKRLWPRAGQKHPL